MALELTRRRFTVADYYQIAAAGILGEDDRVELIDGEILQMSPIGPRHAGTLVRLLGVFTRLETGVALVSPQNPLRLGDLFEPQPDIMILRPRSDSYTLAHPTAGDVLLLVEIADSSLEYDRQIKLPLYARAGVPEVWLVNLNANLVELHRDPEVGGYRTVIVRRPGEWLAPRALPGQEVAVTDVLGESVAE